MIKFKRETIFLITMLCVVSVFASCKSRTSPDTAPEPSSESTATSESAAPQTTTAPESSASEASSEPEPEESESEAHGEEESAIFGLGLEGEGEELFVGDALGDWTLDDLQIDYMDDGAINMLEARFTGDVTLSGMLMRSDIVSGGFDFMVAAQDEKKMPFYVSPDMGPKDSIWFMPDIPEELSAGLELENGAALECKITVSDYRFIFAYTMAPAGATVTNLEVL